MKKSSSYAFDKAKESNSGVYVLKNNKPCIKERGMEAGQLSKVDLKHCRKLKNRKYALHIVFHQIDNKIEIIEIVASGKRSKSEVYNNATRRLKGSNMNSIVPVVFMR